MGDLIFLVSCECLILWGAYKIRNDKEAIAKKFEEKGIPISYQMLWRFTIFGIVYGIFLIVRHLLR